MAGTAYEDHVAAVSELTEAERGFSTCDYELARSESESCTTMDPSVGRAWEILGLLALRDGDLYSAFGHLEMALSCKGSFEDAEAAFEVLEGLGDLASLGPEEADAALDGLGSTLVQRRRYASALSLYDGIHTRTSSWRTASTIGFLKREMGLLEGSLAAYEEALAIEGAPPEVLSDISVVLIKLGRLEEAEGALSSCLESGLHKPNIMNNLGFVREAQEDLDGALDAYEQAIEMDPKYYPALYSKGRILQKMGKMAEARTYMDQALKLEGRVYRLEDVQGQKDRQRSGRIHAKEIMKAPPGEDAEEEPPEEDGDD